MMESELTSGSLATAIAVPIAFVVSVVLAWLFFRVWRGSDDDFDRTMFSIGAILFTVLSVATPVLTWWGMYPWKYEYHHWVPVSGVVDTVDSRLVPAGENTMEGKFVVKFVGGDAQYGVLDTRAAGLKAGDRLTITCVRIYQWAGTHGYDCNFVSLERAK